MPQTPRPIFAACLAGAVVALAVGGVPPAFGRTGSDDGLCLEAARRAAAEEGVPLQVLLAVTLTETGRERDGRLTPWPWALNEAGESRWFDSRDQALDHLALVLASGATNVDVGCFQLNYRWHGQAFASLEDMIDPRANATYAARLLKGLAQDGQDWIAAVGQYHSQTPEYAETYLDRFRPILAAVTDADLPQVTPAAASPRVNRFPLLQTGAAAGSAGSLFPRQSAARPLFGAP